MTMTVPDCDVNMVAEPKSHQTGRKRQNIAKTGNDWDYYYDSYYAQVGFPTPRLVPPMKRARIHLPPPLAPRAPRKNLPAIKSYSNTSLSELKSYSTPDILICGNCRELFSDVEQLMEHKKSYCKLRFTCKCHTRNGCTTKSLGEEPASLLCSQCKDSFHTAWDLMVHVQAAHMLNIYQLGGDIKTASSEDQTEEEQEHGIEEVNGLEEDEVVGELFEGEGRIVVMNSHGVNHNSENNSSPFLPPGVVIEEMMSTSHGHSSPTPGPGQQLRVVVEESNGNPGAADIKSKTETPEGRNRKNPSSGGGTFQAKSVSPVFTFPMEVATQTQTQGEGGMDNPNNFDCGMESTMLGTMGVQFPYSIASTSSPLENKSA